MPREESLRSPKKHLVELEERLLHRASSRCETVESRRRHNKALVATKERLVQVASAR